MNEPNDPPPTVPSLRAELHRLIDKIATRPGAIKLLLGLRSQARIFADYKAHRVHPPKPKPRTRKPND